MTDSNKHTPHPEPIPEFQNREEEAALWETHDLADYWDTFKPVRARFRPINTAWPDPPPGAKPPGSEDGTP